MLAALKKVVFLQPQNQAEILQIGFPIVADKRK
jgi:hypothetical protein